MMKLKDKVYDVLKWIALYLLPALGTLWFMVGKAWELPYQSEVLETITALDTFLGVLLGISKASYQGDGDLLIHQGDEDGMLVELNEELTDLEDRKTVTFKVVK